MYKTIKLLIIPFLVSFLTVSCGSNYVVSNNSYAPTQTSHFTQNGFKIPKAGVSYENSLKLKEAEKLVLDADIDNSDLTINTEAYNSTVDQLLSEAKTYLGTPYRYGGSTRRGIDCSAFTQKVFNSINYTLPRVSASQATKGDYVQLSEVKKGDLLFFNTSGRRISHVGIVENVSKDGTISFIHAASSKGVSIATLKSSYWSKRFRFAKRILS